jgi:NADH-quinone oxidoreductase subunit J
MERILFGLFAGMALLGGAAVVTTRNPMRGAMALVGSLFALAGLYLLLLAQLLAAIQVLVYAGAVMVLFLFVIMLLNLPPDSGLGRRWTLGRVLGAGTAGLITGALLRVVTKLPLTAESAPASDFGSVASVGRALFNVYTLPFEAVSLLLLTALVAAVVIAKGKI